MYIGWGLFCLEITGALVYSSWIEVDEDDEEEEEEAAEEEKKGEEAGDDSKEDEIEGQGRAGGEANDDKSEVKEVEPFITRLLFFLRQITALAGQM